MIKINKLHNMIRLYSKRKCLYCTKAKNMLNELGIEFEETKLDPEKANDKLKIDRLVKLTNQYTFPFIFEDKEFIGGYTDLEHRISTSKPELLEF